MEAILDLSSSGSMNDDSCRQFDTSSTSILHCSPLGSVQSLRYLDCPLGAHPNSISFVLCTPQNERGSSWKGSLGLHVQQRSRALSQLAPQENIWDNWSGEQGVLLTGQYCFNVCLFLFFLWFRFSRAFTDSIGKCVVSEPCLSISSK